ncbi:MAG: hypothetical protein HC912_08485 [Saprospiraceae bacterium]|nr:hypothetical protein [Saprospiraceae bacterium]
MDACGNVSLPEELTVTVDNDFHDWSMAFPLDDLLFCTERITPRRIEPATFIDPVRASRGICNSIMAATIGQ